MAHLQVLDLIRNTGLLGNPTKTRKFADKMLVSPSCTTLREIHVYNSSPTYLGYNILIESCETNVMLKKLRIGGITWPPTNYGLEPLICQLIQGLPKMKGLETLQVESTMLVDMRNVPFMISLLLSARENTSLLELTFGGPNSLFQAFAPLFEPIFRRNLHMLRWRLVVRILLL